MQVGLNWPKYVGLSTPTWLESGTKLIPHGNFRSLATRTSERCHVPKKHVHYVPCWSTRSTIHGLPRPAETLEQNDHLILL